VSKYKFLELKQEEFEKFAQGNPQFSFTQTPAFAHLRNSSGWSTEFVGVKEGGNIVAGCVLASTKARFGKFFDTQNGFLCDFANLDLLKFFTTNLKEYCRKNGGYIFQMNPYCVYQFHDFSGKPIGEKNEKAIQNLKSVGFKHAGFNKDYGVVPRWIFVKDLNGLTVDNYRSSFDKKMRNNISRALKHCVFVKELTKQELKEFAKITDSTSKRRGFSDKSISYYESVYDLFGENAKFLIAYLDVEKSMQQLEKEISEHKQFIEEMQGKELSLRKEKELKTRKAEIERLEKRKKDDEILKGEENPLPLACALFILNRREVVYLFSGTQMEFVKYSGPSVLQDYMTKKSIELGIKRYNFYGIEGVFDDPTSSGAGVLAFKQKFGGEIEELLGTFYLPLNLFGKLKLLK
jgi:alanine adding enzyme